MTVAEAKKEAKVIKKATKLMAGMVITVQNENKYCQGGINTCHAAAAVVFRVIDAGDGFIALHDGKAEYKGIHYPSLM